MMDVNTVYPVLFVVTLSLLLSDFHILRNFIFADLRLSLKNLQGQYFFVCNSHTKPITYIMFKFKFGKV